MKEIIAGNKSLKSKSNFCQLSNQTIELFFSFDKHSHINEIFDESNFCSSKIAYLDFYKLEKKSDFSTFCPFKENYKLYLLSWQLITKINRRNYCSISNSILINYLPQQKTDSLGYCSANTTHLY